MPTAQSSPKRLAQGFLAAALVLAAACAELPASYPTGSRRPSPALPPPSRPQDGLRANPARLDFGGLAAGETAILQAEVWNGGERGVDLRQAVVDGGDFFIREDGCSGKLLLPGRGCILTVGFSPSGSGSRSGSLLIIPDDPYAPRLTLTLRGEGEARRRPTVRVEPDSLDFGEVELGRSSTLTVEISNEGRADLEVHQVNVEGSDFEKAQDPCGRRLIGPGRSCKVSVRFTPSSGFSSRGVLTVSTGDPSARLVSVPLRGEGGSRRQPRAAVRPERVDFGRVDAGRTKAAELEVRNEGKADLEVREVVVEGKSFSLKSDSCSGRLVSPGRSCALSVTFSPSARGSFSGLLRVSSNDPDGRRARAVLTGEGEAGRPEIRVSPPRLDFGEVAAGETRVLEATVRNVGSDNLRLRGLTVVGAGFELGAEDCSGRALGPSRTCSAAVRFSPASRGDHEGRLEIGSRDADERLVVPLRGSAAAGRDRPCARVRLGAFQGEEEDESRVRMKKLVAEGMLRVGECVTYTLKLEEPGNLYACVPSGYSFGAEGFERMRGEQCRVRGDETRYQKYLRPDIRGGMVLDDITLTRGEGSAREFRLILRFEGR